VHCYISPSGEYCLLPCLELHVTAAVERFAAVWTASIPFPGWISASLEQPVGGSCTSLCISIAVAGVLFVCEVNFSHTGWNFNSEGARSFI
jgi:hypothetical protein